MFYRTFLLGLSIIMLWQPCYSFILPTAIITQIKTVDIKKGDNIKRRQIYVSDCHPQPKNQKQDDKSQNKQQLDALSYILEQKNIKPTHILVEEPLQINGKYTNNPKITSHISEKIKNFKNISVENIEIRQPSIAAMTLLSSDNDVLKESFYDKNQSFAFLRFKDVLENFETTKNKLKTAYTNRKHQFFTKLFERKVKKATTRYNTLKNLLSQKKIDIGTPIMQQSFNEHLKNELINELIFTFEDLLDLHLLDCILQHSNAPNLLIIAGHHHTKKVSHYINQLGGKTVNNIGTTDLNNVQAVDVNKIEPNLLFEKEIKE